MTVIEMLAEYLKENGYDGLCGQECGCEIDDLAPCDEVNRECVAGHKESCTPTDGCWWCEGRFYRTDEPRPDKWCMKPGPRPQKEGE